LKNRIVGSGNVDVATLKANPKNWRTHTDEQRRAMSDVLEQVGWVQRVIVNKTTENMIDGHLRVEIASERKEKSVPVVFVELTPKEEDVILASFDPISSLAGLEPTKLAELLDDLEVEGEGLGKMLEEMAEGIAKKRGSGDEKPEVEFSEELLEEHNFVVLYFDNSVDWLNLLSILELPSVKASHSKPGFKVQGIGRVVRGADALEKFRKWGASHGGE
jgi:ParB-like chromosome segregation protein Spo0J